jgi:hypothetical protein
MHTMGCGPSSSDDDDDDRPKPLESEEIDTFGLVKQTANVEVGPMFEEKDAGTQYNPPRRDQRPIEDMGDSHDVLKILEQELSRGFGGSGVNKSI